MIGARFGRFEVLGIDRKQKNGTYVKCRCECGTEKVVFLGSLKKGTSKSCGCLNAELSRARRLTHGLTKTRTHNVWMNMRARCYKPSNPAFKDYGGRGIMVCDQWKSSFESFLADMGVCPDGMSIERLDNDGNYEPNNCRWATPKEQANNRRSNLIVSYQGEKGTVSEWASKLGVDYFWLHNQLKRHSWNLSKVFNKSLGETAA